jgi:hypothetical protein
MDRAHNRLGRLHRKLGTNYADPDDIPPLKPKWMMVDVSVAHVAA